MQPEVIMADIFQDVPIKAPPDRVFQAVSTPEGLDRWWTKRSAGEPVEGAKYELWFGPQYDWRAQVTRCIADREFEFQMVLERLMPMRAGQPGPKDSRNGARKSRPTKETLMSIKGIQWSGTRIVRYL
jgi:hypothetical protein